MARWTIFFAHKTSVEEELSTCALCLALPAPSGPVGLSQFLAPQLVHVKILFALAQRNFCWGFSLQNACHRCARISAAVNGPTPMIWCTSHSSNSNAAKPAAV